MITIIKQINENIMKKIFYSLYMFGVATLCMVAISCSDELTELTEVSYDRLFSPIDLEVRVRQQVNAAVSWKAVNKATGYSIELYQGETVAAGTLIQSETTLSTSYTFTKLEGSEAYAVRVKATGSSIPESKWVEASFKTDAEQIFYEVDPALIEAKQATLTWPAGENVQTLHIMPGEIKRTLTSAEIAEGKAVITGLASETEYTVNLLRGTKIRGTVTFTTPVDLDGAIPLYADATEEEIKLAFQNLAEGDKICLLPAADGTTAFVPAEVTLSVSCSVMALQSKPVTADLCFKIDGTASDITIKDLNFKSDKSVAFCTILNVSAGANIKISNCTIDSYSKVITEDEHSSSVQTGDLTVENCVITNISGHGIDFQKKHISFSTFTLKNSTAYNACNGQNFIRFDFVRTGVVYTVTNNTIYDVKASNKGLVYIRSNKAGNHDFTCNVSKNIFAFSAEATDVFFTEDSKSDNILFDSNYYLNAGSLLANPSTGSGKAFDTAGIVADPKFKDAANGDFTVGNEDIIYYKIGDPRWH